jgi:hypothetical protein
MPAIFGRQSKMAALRMTTNNYEWLSSNSSVAVADDSILVDHSKPGFVCFVLQAE